EHPRERLLDDAGCRGDRSRGDSRLLFLALAPTADLVAGSRSRLGPGVGRTDQDDLGRPVLVVASSLDRLEVSGAACAVRRALVRADGPVRSDPAPGTLPDQSRLRL